MIKFSYYIKKDSSVDRIIQFAASLFFTLVRKSIIQHEIHEDVILIISLHRLGDTVFTIPAIKALRRASCSKIVIACYEDSKKIYDLAFNDQEYLILKKENFYFSGRIANSAARKKIKNINAGTVIDITGGINSALLIFNNKAGKIVGFNDKYFKKIYSDYIPSRKIPHLMDMYLEAAKLIVNIEDEDSLKYFGKSLEPSGDILIHPFAGWKSKEWGFEKFIELSQRINKYYKSKFVIPLDHADDKTLAYLNSKKIACTISKDIQDLIDAIKKASIVIGCDSGAVYISSLLGKPTFTIYGPTNPRFSLPYGIHHDYIVKETALTPKDDEQYGYADAGRKEPGCDFMNLVTVEEVSEKINQFYKKVFNETD